MMGPVRGRLRLSGGHRAGNPPQRRAHAGDGVIRPLELAIVTERERNGPFPNVDDLQRVPGIGPARLEALRDLKRIRRERVKVGLVGNRVDRRTLAADHLEQFFERMALPVLGGISGS